MSTSARNYAAMTEVQAHLDKLAQDPGDAAALEAIEAAYSAAGRWEELLRVYEDNTGSVSREQVAPILRKAATVCLTELSSAPRAEAYLTRALEADPSDVESLRALRRIYTDRGDHERVAEVFERELARVQDAATKAAGLVELAELHRVKLQRLDKALTVLRQAQRVNKSNASIYGSMAEIYTTQGRQDQAQAALMTELEVGGTNDDVIGRLSQQAKELLSRPKLHELARATVEAVLQHKPDDTLALAAKQELDAYTSSWSQKISDLEQRAIQIGGSDRAAAADVWLTVAEIQLVYGQQPDVALGSLDKAAAGKPGHAGALQLMEEIYGSQGRYEDLALKLEMMAAYTRDTEVAVELYLKSAMHYAVRLDDTDAAATVHERVLEVDPGNKISSNALAEYYRETKRWDDALRVLSIWAERATQASDKVAAHYACCRILDEELGDRARARPHYEAILALDPDNTAAARALDEVYRAAGDHAALARVMRAKLSATSGKARLEILGELGELYAGPLEQPEEALEVLGTLYQAEPEAKLREQLEELAARAGAFAQLVKILEGGLDQIQKEPDRVQALHSIAALYEGARDAPLEALRIHRRILALVPTDERAKESVVRLMKVAERTGDKVAFYEEQAEAAGSDAERVPILYKLAQELVETAKDYVRASDVYRRILKMAPSEVAALDGLAGLYRRDNRWDELVDALMQKSEVVAGSDRVATLIELAQILESKLNQVDRAVDGYRAALGIAPGNNDAIAGLERLATRSKHVGQIADILQPHYLSQGQWDRAAAMIEIRVKGALDAGARAELLTNLAALYDSKLNKPAEALAALLRAFQADPSVRNLQADLERLAGKTGDYSGVVRAYRAAGLTLEGDERVEMLHRAGAAAEKGGDAEGAAVDYLRGLGVSEALDAKALESLARLLRAGIEATRIRDVATQIAEGLEQPRLAAFWRKLARFYEQTMNSANDAIIAWKSVLQAHHNDPEATAELDRLYQTTDDPAELMAHLRAKLSEAEDDTTRAALGGQIAEVLADKAGDLHGAIAELAKVAEAAPGQRLVWQRLAALQMRADRPQDAAQAIHKELGLLPDGDERNERLVQYAELLAKLGDVATAAQALQGVVTQQPAHPAAIDLLASMTGMSLDPATAEAVTDMLLAGYRAAERWQDAVAVLSARINTLDDVDRRIASLREIAALKADKIGDRAGAYADLDRAFRERPTDPELRADLERLAESAQAWEQLVETYGSAIGVVTDTGVQHALRRKLAEVLDKKLERGAEAIEHYQAATGGQLPEDLPSLEAMERLLREQNRASELADVLYAIVVKLPADQADKRRTLLFELGHICETSLGDKPRAVESYKRILDADSKDVGAARKLETLYEQLDRPEERAAALRVIVEQTGTSPEAVDDLIKLAGVAVQLGAPQEAIKHYRAVLLKRREHPEALAGLEALLDLAQDKAEIAQILEPIYTAKQDHEKLAAVLDAKLQGTEDKSQRKSLLRRIGDIYENRLQQKERAFEMARRSLHEDPADMGVRMWIEKLAGETGAMSELAAAYVEEAQRAESQLALQFHRRAAAIYHDKVSDTGAAVGEYQAILVLEPRDEKALTGLEAIFRASEAYADLVGVLRRRLEATAGIERKREYLAEIATLQSQRLADPSGAVATYKEVLALTPDDIGAFGQIEQLLAQSGRWEELGTFYEAEVERLSEKRGRDAVARRLEYHYRRGRILDEQFGERGQAAQVFAAILGENAAHASTIGYLEHRAQQGVVEAIELLETVYAGAAQWPKLVALLELKLNHTAETERRRDVYVKLAETFDEHVHAGDMAFQALSRAFNENRADLELVERLEELAGRHNYWAELVQVIGVDLDAIADPSIRQHMLRRLGAISGEYLGDVQRAVGYLQQALQYEPGDVEALEALDAILDKNEMWAALADLLERRIELASEPSDKSRLLERLAQVWSERLMDAEAALRCHQQILEIDPDHPISLQSMQKLYAEVQDWDSLAKNLQRQAEVLTDSVEQIRIHAAAGELYAEELGDNDEAIAHYQRVAELDPTHQQANDSLRVLLTAEERWEEVADLYRRILAHTQDPAAKAEINQALGVILGEKLGRTEDALGSWLQVLEGDAKNLDALRALLGLYSERAMWQEFVDIARRIIPLTDPAEAKEVRFLLAKALGENLGEREEAIKLAREVRATEPHTADQLTRLAEMLKTIEAFDEAVIALEKAAALEEDGDVKTALFWEAAEIYQNQLGKPNDARAAFEAIREVTPEEPAAYEALADVYRNTGDWRKLVALNEDFVPHADAATRLQVLTEIRDVQDEKLGEKELAFIAACRVFKEDPADAAAAKALERLGIETDGAEELVAVIEDEVDAIVEPSDKVAIYRRIARVYSEHLNDTPSAEAALANILEIDPSDVTALDSLAGLGARDERYDKQIAALENKLQHVVEQVQRKAVLFEIARIWEDQIGEIDEAISALQRVLELDGADTNALDALARLYEQEARWAELAHTLTRKVELEDDTAKSIELRMRVAALCEGDLGDPEAAIQWYRGVLDFDEGHSGALESLERLYTGQERWSELVQTFELQIANTAQSEEKIAILSKMASIYEAEFESAKDAAACYERVFEIDSSHVISIRNLERLLRQLGEWNRLIEVLSHHISLTSESEEITELYIEIGEVYYKELGRVDKAEEIYNAARDFNPNSAEALHALGQLYERSGNWFQSLEMLQREADLLGAEAAALPVLLRIGKINEDMLMDVGSAQQAYQRALEIDPNYAPALQAMKEIARAAEDWEVYAEHLIAEAESSDDAEDKTELFFEAAKFYYEVREDEANAVRYFTRALEITPGHLESARLLAEINFRNESWQQAGDLYEIVVSKIDKADDPKDYCQKNYRLGYISEKLGNREAALAYYREAFEADATYLPALEGLGQALLAAQEWDEAQKVFQTILIHHRDSLTESEIVDVQWQLGDICLQQEQPDRAYRQFEKALEIDPDHGPSLAALAQLDQQMENWEGAYEKLSRLADAVAGIERGEVLLELSDIARTQLGDVGRSVEALERARRMGQPPPEVLEQLAHAYLETHQPQKAVEVLEQAVDLTTDPEQLSELSFQLAQVYETEIRHMPLAVQKYNDALDTNAKNIKAFEAIERILSSSREWGLLEQNYRAMVARAKDLNPQIRLVLWRSLADLYRKVLKNVDSAIMAYEVVQKLEPGKAEDTAILADLYAQKPEHRKKAIEMAHQVVRTRDNPVDEIRNLRRLYHAQRDFDAVYVLCSALAFLKAADEEERKIFEYLQQGVPARATQRLLEENWKAILHPDLHGPVGTLASWLYRSAADLFTRPAKDLGLKKKDQIDVRGSDLYFANMMRYVGKMLNIQSVDLFRKAGSMESLHLAPAQPPALVAGENNEVFRDAPQKVVLFHIGRTLTYARPESFLARIYPGDELRDLLFGLCAVYNRTLQHNGDPREVGRWVQALERMQPQALKRLQQPARTAFQELVSGRGVERYAAAVELTAARAGLLACGDLGAAVHGITEGGEGASSLPIRSRVKELVLFAVSPEHLQLRKLVGAALAENQGGKG